MKPKTWIWLLACFAGPAFSHGGGLDADGCHTNRKTGDHHCHRAKNTSAPSGQGAAQATKPSPGAAGVPTCYTGPRGGTYTITKSGRKNYSGC